MNGKLDYAFGPEGGGLKHLLEANDVVVVDYFEDLLEALFLVVILVSFDWGRS